MADSYREENSDTSEKTSLGDLTIILVGKSGVGKSATGNSILQKNVFPSKLSAQPVTEAVQKDNREWKGRTLCVVDTPPISGLTKREVTEGEERLYVLIMVIQLGRYTEEDREVYRHVKKIFNKPYKKMVFLFTRKEDLEGRNLSDYVKNPGNKHLKKLIKKHKIPCCAFNNKTDEEKEKQSQLDDLMKTIMDLCKIC